MYYLKKKKKETKGKTPKGNKPSVSTLVRKLDSEFSLYIRLRDSRNFGYKYFRCISCGQIKPYEQMDCGHFIGRTHMATRFDEANCWGECRNCLTPDALVLTADLRWTPLGELHEGDEIVGFTELGRGKAEKRRHWEKSMVTHLHREMAEVFDVELENGDHIKTTADHKWLVHNRKAGYKWMETKEMWINGYNLYGKKKTGPHTEKMTTIVCKPFLVCHKDESSDAGWLAGMIDADGHICQQNIHDPKGTIRYGFRIGVAQSETYPYICERIICLMEHFTGNHKPCRQSMEKSHSTIKSNVRTRQYIVTGTNVEKLQFLMRVCPMKARKVDVNKLGEVRSKYDTKVKEITPIGKQEIVVMETSTHTFIANGYMMHNCNRFSSDHMIYYQRNLEKKIGREKLDMLIARGHGTKKWTAWELEILIEHYKQENKKMIQERDGTSL